MKYCLSTYSYGGYLSQFGIDGVIRKTAELGFDGIEFAQDEWFDHATDEELRRIGGVARQAGLTCVNLCVNGDMLNGSDANLDAEVERICRYVDKAVLLGVPMMRHDAAHMISGRKHGIGFSANLDRIAEGCRRITEYAATRGIRTLTENHGYFSQDADRVSMLIDRVNHPNFGALVDIGNFGDVDEIPALSVSRLAPYAYHVHCKDCLVKKGTEINPGECWYQTRGGNYCRGTIIGHGDFCVSQSLGTLKRLGYDGYLSVEYEGIEDALHGIRISLDNLKRFWDMA